MKENVTYEEVENKNYKRADRMLRSAAARARRKVTKQIKEMKLFNEWAHARRERKNAK